MTLSPSNPEAVLRQPSNPSFFQSMTASGDNVYLYDSGGRLLDMVGWSSPHTQGLSMSRVPDGFGSHNGYNDVTSEMAGWVFDMFPTMWFVRIGPDQAKNGEANEQVKYELVVTNKDLSAHYFNIDYITGPDGWVVDLYEADGSTHLSDSAGDPDIIPDIGSLNPEESRKIVVGVTVRLAFSVNAVEETRVHATASDDSTTTDFAVLRTRPYPDVVINKTANPSTIFVETAGPEFKTESTITLSVSGTGSSVEWNAPQDVIFLIDQSKNMATSFGLERQVALNYLDNLRKPDMAAVIYFDYFPNPRRPLSPNYEQVRLDIYSEAHVSRWKASCIGEAIVAALRELEMNGNDSHMPVILLLSDGSNITGRPDSWTAATYAKENQTRIYTLGIAGEYGLSESVMMEIANISGGEYRRIDNQHDFDGMYENISHFVSDMAARDPNPFDLTPMIEDFLPPVVHYVEGSFVDPVTGQAKPPDVLLDTPTGAVFQWFNRMVRVGETWSVSFNVTISKIGLVSVDLYPDSRVTYATWNGTNVSVPFPDVKVLVLPPIHPPAEVWASLEGPSRSDVRILWTLSEDDPGIVTFYDVYYGTAFNADGDGYQLLERVSNGVDSSAHLGAGEGDPSDYFYRVCAGAFIGGSLCGSVQAAKFTRPLSNGPNLISIPLVQSNEPVEHVLQTVEYDKAWNCDSLSQEWKWFMKFKGYRRGLWNIDHTMGLWVNVTRDSNLTVAGIVPTSTYIHLAAGWNLVGFPSFNSSYTNSDLKADTGAVRVEGYDSMPPFYLRVLGDGEVLQAGWAYWVRVEADTVWSVVVS